MSFNSYRHPWHSFGLQMLNELASLLQDRAYAVISSFDFFRELSDPERRVILGSLMPATMVYSANVFSVRTKFNADVICS